MSTAECQYCTRCAAVLVPDDHFVMASSLCEIVPCAPTMTKASATATATPAPHQRARRRRPFSSGISSSPVSTSAPTEAPKPAEAARLDEADETSEEHGTGDRPHDQRPVADHDDDPDRQEACDEAREVVRVAERRPHGARRTERRAGVHEVDPVPVRAELEVGGLDEAVQHDEPARRRARKSSGCDGGRSLATTRRRRGRRRRTRPGRAGRRRTGRRRRGSGGG